MDAERKYPISVPQNLDRKFKGLTIVNKLFTEFFLLNNKQ